MNVRIFWVCAMECMCAQTRPRFILSSKRVLGNEVRTHVNSKGKTPSSRGSEEGQTWDAASCRTVSPTHYQLSFSSPIQNIIVPSISKPKYIIRYGLGYITPFCWNGDLKTCTFYKTTGRKRKGMPHQWEWELWWLHSAHAGHCLCEASLSGHRTPWCLHSAVGPVAVMKHSSCKLLA